MRVALVTPLYPPDIGDLAVFIKELAHQIKKDAEVVIVTYGRFPEHIPGVKIICTNKKTPIILRIPIFIVRLFNATQNVDGLIVTDGAAVGLPSLFVSRMRGIPLIRLLMRDEIAERLLTSHIQKRKSSFFSKWKKKILAALQIITLRFAKHIVVPSQQTADFFTKTNCLSNKHFSIETYPTPKPRILPPNISISPAPNTIEFHTLSWQLFSKKVLSLLQKDAI